MGGLKEDVDGTEAAAVVEEAGEEDGDEAANISHENLNPNRNPNWRTTSLS